MAIAGPIFAKSRLARQIYINKSYAELNENMTEGLFSDERSLTDMRGHHTRRSSLFRKQRLRKRKVKATAYLRIAQSAGLRGDLTTGTDEFTKRIRIFWNSWNE